jgi:hypothetical protein
MLRRDLVPPRDLGNDRAQRIGFRYDLRLDVVTPAPTPNSATQ